MKDIISTQSSENLALYFDIDPEGLDMDMAISKGYILMPKQWDTLSSNTVLMDQVNQRNVYRRQQGALNRLRARALNNTWAKVVQVIEQDEIAIMQEHITRRYLAIEAYKIDGGSDERTAERT